ncbi:protein mono-ADP-ribosyltransferase PARP12-like isoform X1 [Amphibalanus amphitrite]|nr:protein mono-ADP-ribosyltransferase PARP12-like isoform X1 [Amphibalanus amphitrite]
MGSGESVPTAPAGATVPDICPAYNSAAAYCTSDSCLSLHICQGFVIGNCLYGERCSRTHQLTTVHNQLVLKVNNWTSSEQHPQLMTMLKEKVGQGAASCNGVKISGLPTPELCLDYNALGCVREDCNKLHLCLHFILKQCNASEGQCRFMHDFGRDEHNMLVLRGAGLLDIDQSVIIKNLSEKYRNLYSEKQNIAKAEPRRGDGASVRQTNDPTLEQAERRTEKAQKEADKGAPKPRKAPSACIEYNKRFCTNPSCPFLHVCFSYLMGRCNKKSSCLKEHNIFRGEHNKEILQKFNLLDAEDVFATIREGYAARKAAKKAAAVECPEGATGGEEPPSAPQRAGAGAPVSLTCAVCHELFVRATTLGCTHTFCEGCVRDVQRQRQPCPLCRAPIATAVRSLVIDDTVAEWFDGQDEETRRARRQLEAERRRQT